ncbi:MAG: hypothetical protein SH817_13970 [Leptospira sp.]|nr:hypothetical protein [Leptospira sp.]
MRRILSIALLCLPLLGCFEYEETILFRKPNSGTVEIAYTVPLKKESAESLIKFLPSDLASIEKKIKLKPNSGLSIRDFTFRELEKIEITDPIFKRKGRVSYKIDFEDPSQLEGILLGNFVAKQKARSLNIKREFPNMSEFSATEESVGEKKIIGETLRLLKEGKMQFRVLFPKDSECLSNRGLVGLGNVVYSFPLQDTIENADAKSWEYKIRFF